MKIVDFTELVSMPTGTIFADFEPCFHRELRRRGEVIVGQDGKPIDFYECDVASFSPNGDGPCVSNCEGRWGLFDYSKKYLVWEKDDIERMVRILTGTDTEQDNIWPDAPIYSE